MALPAFVQQVATSTSGFLGTKTSAAFGTTPTTGNSILVLIVTESASLDITSVSNSGTANTYTRLASKLNTGGSPSIEAWFAQNITGSASMTITVNDSGFVIGGFVAMEISGLPTTGNVLDKSTGSINGFVSPISTTMSGATTNANDILVYAVAEASSSTTFAAGALGGSTGANFVQANGSSTATTIGTETQVVSATGTYSGAITSTITNAGDTGLLLALSNTAIISASLVIIPYRRVNQSVMTAAGW